MLLSLELNARQAARVLEHARRAGARVELAMRCLPDDQLLFGTLRSEPGATMRVDLDGGGRVAPAALVGTYCDVTLLLPGELYQFTTCVADVGSGTANPHVTLAAPDAITLVNRRRFERTKTTQHTTALIRGEAGDHCGRLDDISANGVALVLPLDEERDEFYIGDAFRVRFELPGSEGYFDLPVHVCSKSVDRVNLQLVLGLEFVADPVDTGASEGLMRLRALLFEMTVDLYEADKPPCDPDAS